MYFLFARRTEKKKNPKIIDKPNNDERQNTTAVRAMGSTFGRMFRVTTFGESHGGGVGCVVDGVPPRLQISREELQFELDARRPGQSRIAAANEEDGWRDSLGSVSIVTLGTPIAVLVRNKDHRSQDYGEIAVAYRPSLPTPLRHEVRRACHRGVAVALPASVRPSACARAPSRRRCSRLNARSSPSCSRVKEAWSPPGGSREYDDG